MAVFQKTIRLKTRGHADLIDITDPVTRIITESGVGEGIVNISGVGSTLGITTIEFEPGAVADFQQALDRIAPPSDDYAHNARWGDHNGFAHLRSALIGTAKSFPISNGALHLGTWQQIVLCDFDDRPRDREITVTIVA